MYASRELQRGFVPLFLNVLLRQSVLEGVSVSAGSQNSSLNKVPFDSTLLSATFSTHPLAYNGPKHVVIHVLPLFHGHVCHDLSKPHFFLLLPWASGPFLGVLDVVPVAIPTVRCHSTNSFANLLPLLPKLLYGSR